MAMVFLSSVPNRSIINRTLTTCHRPHRIGTGLGRVPHDQGQCSGRTTVDGNSDTVLVIAVGIDDHGHPLVIQIEGGRRPEQTIARTNAFVTIDFGTQH
jgi:hypothetical protein